MRAANRTDMTDVFSSEEMKPRTPWSKSFHVSPYTHLRMSFGTQIHFLNLATELYDSIDNTLIPCEGGLRNKANGDIKTELLRGTISITNANGCRLSWRIEGAEQVEPKTVERSEAERETAVRNAKEDLYGHLRVNPKLPVIMLLILWYGLFCSGWTSAESIESFPVQYEIIQEENGDVESYEGWERLGSSGDTYLTYYQFVSEESEDGIICKYIDQKGKVRLSVHCMICTAALENYCATDDGKSVTIWNLENGQAVFEEDQYLLMEAPWIRELPFVIQNKRSGQFALFDPYMGTILLDEAIEEVLCSENGYCRFRSREKRWGYLNRIGEICIPDLYLSALDFNDIGIAPVKIEEGEWKIIRKDGSNYSDKTYREVLEIDYEYIICEDQEGNMKKIDLDGEHEYTYSEIDEDDYSEIDEDDE